MKKIVEKRSNKLLWISLAVFTLTYLVIIGYHWLFNGHFGDATYTISMYVGLAPWSSLLFCVTNLAIAVMLIVYILTQAKMRGFLWRLMMFAFVICFIGLSIAPRVPFEGDTVIEIHHFFSYSMFVIIALLAFYTAAAVKDKFARTVATLIVAYAAFFIVGYLLNAAFLDAGIFWYESAVVFAFFALVISSNRIKG